jgi:hypothetical protein
MFSGDSGRLLVWEVSRLFVQACGFMGIGLQGNCSRRSGDRVSYILLCLSEVMTFTFILPPVNL